MVRPILGGCSPKKTTYSKRTYAKPVKQFWEGDGSVVLSVTEGQKVHHKLYGEGIVESIDTDSAQARIRFDKNRELHSFSIPNDFLTGNLKLIKQNVRRAKKQ